MARHAGGVGRGPRGDPRERGGAAVSEVVPVAPAPPVRRGGRTGSPHVEGKRLRKRRTILESAVQSFARRGFYGTSMDDIAEDLSLTRGSLYYYFRDKEEILALCHLTALEAVNASLDRVRRERLAPDAALRRLVVEHVRIMVDGFHGSALALEVDALDAVRRAEVVALRDRYERGLRETIAEGVRAGIFRDVDVKLTAFAVFGSINWVARWYREGGGAGPSEIAEVFARLFLEGFLRAGEERT